MEEPPYLAEGTEVSAKYRGAFCEASIKSVKKLVKCKVIAFHKVTNECRLLVVNFILYCVVMDFVSGWFLFKVNFENGGGNSTVTDDCIIGEVKVMYQSNIRSKKEDATGPKSAILVLSKICLARIRILLPFLIIYLAR